MRSSNVTQMIKKRSFRALAHSCSSRFWKLQAGRKHKWVFAQEIGSSHQQMKLKVRPAEMLELLGRAMPIPAGFIICRAISASALAEAFLLSSNCLACQHL